MRTKIPLKNEERRAGKDTFGIFHVDKINKIKNFFAKTSYPRFLFAFGVTQININFSFFCFNFV
jgi:hypothetical protein